MDRKIYPYLLVRLPCRALYFAFNPTAVRSQIKCESGQEQGDGCASKNGERKRRGRGRRKGGVSPKYLESNKGTIKKMKKKKKNRKNSKKSKKSRKNQEEEEAMLSHGLSTYRNGKDTVRKKVLKKMNKEYIS